MTLVSLDFFMGSPFLYVFLISKPLLYIYIYIDKGQYIDQKRVYREYTKKGPLGQKEKAREQKEAYKRAQKDNIISIAIESIQKQRNKRDICVWNTNQLK